MTDFKGNETLAVSNRPLTAAVLDALAHGRTEGGRLTMSCALCNAPFTVDGYYPQHKMLVLVCPVGCAAISAVQVADGPPVTA